MVLFTREAIRQYIKYKIQKNHPAPIIMIKICHRSHSPLLILFVFVAIVPAVELRRSNYAVETTRMLMHPEGDIVHFPLLLITPRGVF